MDTTVSTMNKPEPAVEIPDRTGELIPTFRSRTPVTEAGRNVPRESSFTAIFSWTILTREPFSKERPLTVTDHSSAVDLETFSWNNSTPQDALEMCRRAQSLAGLGHSSEVGGYHLAARYEDVVLVEDDTTTYSSSPTVFRPMAPGVPSFPVLEYDPPQHAAWRDIFRELVNPRTVKRLQGQVLRDVDRHIDSVIESGRIDLVHDLAEYVPAETICRAAGIDDMDLAAEIRIAAQAALDVGGRDPAAFPLRLAEFGDIVMPLLAERLAHPQDDFLTRLATAEPEGVPLQHHEHVGMMFALLAAGHHSTTSSISTLFQHVLSRPEVREHLVREPAIIKKVIEESLRLDPPFYGFFRRVTTPAVVAGTPLAENDSICLSWIGANHDPAQFEDPESFRLDRPHYKHLSFGYGIHTCVGAPLARLELQLALQQVLARMPDIELVGEPAQKHFGGGSATYLTSLPAVFTPGPVLGTVTP